MSSGKLPPKVMTGFLVAGVAVVGLFTYAMSLKTDNAELRGRLAVYEAGGDITAGGGGGVEIAGDEESDGGGSGEDDVVTDLPPAGGDVEVPADDETPAVGGVVFGESERATLASQLAFVAPDADRRVWLSVTFGDPGAARLVSALAQVFTDAGFEVQPTVIAGFPVRPGVYFMAADEEPPEHSNVILSALEATGFEVTSGRGYRAFYAEKKRDDPEWNGFEMADDQPFVIVIGRSGT